MSHENILPKSVRASIEAADEIYKAVYSEEDPKPVDPKSEDPKSEDPKSEDPKSEDPKPKDSKPVEDTAEHRFKVLQGKYNKEVPRLHRELRDSKAAEQQLQERVASLEAAIKDLQDPPTPQAPALSQEEINQFGPDLIDIIRRVAKDETGVVLDKKLKPVQETVKHVQETVASSKEDQVLSARRQMLADLADAVPNWEKQNEDEDFLEWLDEKDPYSGKLRSELLAVAYRDNDGESLINLFQGFQKENVVVSPTDQQPEDSEEEEESTESPDGLTELVAPGTPKTGPTGAQNESGKRMWTQAEIKEFYAYKNEFIKKNPEKELPDSVVLQEQDLFKAQHENRIKQ